MRTIQIIVFGFYQPRVFTLFKHYKQRLNKQQPTERREEIQNLFSNTISDEYYHFDLSLNAENLKDLTSLYEFLIN